MKDIYNICFYGGMTLAIIFLIVSIVLFVVFKIPKVIGDLTGRNARREIAEKKNKKGGIEKSESSKILKQEQKKYYNQNTGKITIRDSATNEVETARITSNAESKHIQPEERETDILRPGDEDDIYKTVPGSSKGEEETTVLGGSKGEEETTVLGSSKGEEETTVLGSSKGEEETTILGSGKRKTVSKASDDKPQGSDEEFDPDGETDILRAPDSEDSNDDFDPDGETDVLRAPDSEDSDDDFDADGETDVLKSPDYEDGTDSDDETDVLRAKETTDEEATDILKASDDEEATTVLTGEKSEEATTVLSADSINDSKEDKRVIYEVVIVHTEESL